MDGGLALPIQAGTLLGNAGETLSVQVLTDNFHLDPVALFAALSADPNIELEGDQRSWLEVVDRTRVLISVRNEWNEPRAGRTLVVTTPAGNTPRPLNAANLGTVVLRNSTSFSCEIQSHVLSRFAGASEAQTQGSIDFDVRLPAHVTIGSVNPDDWFQAQDPPLTDPSKRLSRFTFGNQVEPLVDGLPMFARVVADLRAITDSQHFAYLANWYLNVGFPLIPEDPSSTLEEIFVAADAAKGTLF